MGKRTVTIFFSILFLFICANIYGQGAAPIVDKNTPFIVNPNPTVYVPDSPLEEVFGSNANVFGPAGLRGRGNVYHCLTAKKLIEQRSYLNPTAAASMQFLVYEGATFSGLYNLVASTDITSGTGEGWYSSGAMDYDLQVGMYYLIYPQWDVNANYYNQQTITPYPIPCSFGELVGGVGWDWAPVYSVPAAATQTSTGLENTGVAYYQTIVTDDVVPVEMTSFTFNVSGNNVNLNWNTATETNNRGFEVQRRTLSETFKTIGFVNGSGTTTQPQSYSFTDSKLEAGTYIYRLNQVDFDGSSYASDELSIVINKSFSYALEQNYPNPFNPTTLISYSVPERGNVSLVVYDLLGRQVASLVNEVKEPGSYKVNFNASNLPSGIYTYSIKSGNFVQTKKMMLLK